MLLSTLGFSNISLWLPTPSLFINIYHFYGLCYPIHFGFLPYSPPRPPLYWASLPSLVTYQYLLIQFFTFIWKFWTYVSLLLLECFSKARAVTSVFKFVLAKNRTSSTSGIQIDWKSIELNQLNHLLSNWQKQDILVMSTHLFFWL